MGICEFARHGIYTHSSGLSTDGVLARTPGMEPDLMFGSEWKSVTYLGEGGWGWDSSPTTSDVLHGIQQNTGPCDK